jgi:hypothetical protein
MIVELEFDITVPCVNLYKDTELQKREQRSKLLFGDPQVDSNNLDYIRWRVTRRRAGLPLSDHFIDVSEDPISGHKTGNHFPISVMLGYNKGVDISSDGSRLLRVTPEEATKRSIEFHGFYFALFDALKNRRFKSSEDLRIVLYHDTWESKGYPENEKRSQLTYPCKLVRGSGEILKGRDVEFTLYNAPDAENCKGKSCLSFILTEPGAVLQNDPGKPVIKLEPGVTIEYAMAVIDRKVHPVGIGENHLYKLSKCQYSPDFTLSIMAEYLAQDIQFYDSNGELAVWWLNFIDRLKHLDPPRINTHDRYVEYEIKDVLRDKIYPMSFGSWSFENWGKPPYNVYDEEKGYSAYWQLPVTPGPIGKGY